jgi:acetyl/propionyl-CoA carboxylase alpha subunit
MSESLFPGLVKVNDFEFSFTPQDIQSASITRRSADTFHLLYRNRSASIRVLDTDSSGKKIAVEIDGDIFQVEIKEPLDLMIDKMGFGAGAQKAVKQVKAPMPGLILEIAAAEEQELEEGAKLLILVAMKMENSILLPVKAKIRKLHVKTGQAVEKGQLLVELY